MRFFITLLSVMGSALMLFTSCNSIKKSTDISSGASAGLNFYKVINVQPTSDLSYQYFDIDTAILEDTATIKYADIITDDTLDHSMEMSCLKDPILSGIPAGVYGVPFVVVLDSARIYSGFLGSHVSSAVCHRPVIMVDPSDSSKMIRIERSAPVAGSSGTDTRSNHAIIDRLVQDGKAR
jgi:hypothetical protein